jgi:hypothetical protein
VSLETIAVILAVPSAVVAIAVIVKFVITPWRNRRASARAERRVVYDLLENFLLNRRVLYDPFSQEDPYRSIKSVHEIRTRLGEDLERLDETSKAVQPVREMQAACRAFLTGVESLTPDAASGVFSVDVYEEEYQAPFRQALSDLRNVFDSCMDSLYKEYNIPRSEKPPPPGGPRRFGVAAPPADIPPPGGSKHSPGDRQEEGDNATPRES